MAELELEIAHGFSRNEALSKVERLLAAAANGSDTLQDAVFTRDEQVFRFSGQVKGIKVSGDLSVADRAINVRVKLPLAARPFRKPAEKKIREFFERNLV